MELQSIMNSMPTWEMDSKERTLLNLEVDRLNKETFGSRLPKQELGKSEFLELLITQLTHQDPTAPMQDTEFIAQMAQFSSLEQMMNMTETIGAMNQSLASATAINAVGKNVELESHGEIVYGMINAISQGASPEVEVNGNWYSWADVKKIYGDL